MVVEPRICFYDSTKLQGWRKWAIRLMQGTYHTHAHLELHFGNTRLVLLTLDGCSPRVIRLGLNKKFVGVDPYAEFSLGYIPVDEDREDLAFIYAYPPTKHWALIWYQILRWFNLNDSTKVPPTCTTFISDFAYHAYKIHIPRFFSPKQLWSYLHDATNAKRKSPCR